MKAVVYARVSSTDGSQSTQRQIDDLKHYAKSKNLDVVEVFTDEISATKKKFDDRKSFNLMRAYIKENNITNILVSELSRISRRYIDTVNFIEECYLDKINIHIQKDNLTTLRNDGIKDSVTHMMIGMLSSIAEMEAETLSQRICSGKANAARNGGDFNSKIYGYKADENGRPIINEEEAPLVRQIFKMVLEGIGSRRIANYLNDNYKTKNWKAATVHSIVRNSFYCGERKYKKIIIPVPAIVSQEIFREANDFVNSRKRFVGSPNGTYINPFASFIKCACKSVMHQIVQKSNRSENFRCSKQCGISSVNRTFLIREVRMIVENNAKILKDKEVRGRLKLTIDSNTATINNNIREIEKNKNKLDTLFDKWMEKKVTDEKYNSKSNEYSINIEKLDAENLILQKTNKDILGSLEQEILHYSDDLNVFKMQLLKVIESITIDKLEAEVNFKSGTRAIIKIYRGSKLQLYNNYLKKHGNTLGFDFDFNSYAPISLEE
jgi:site-specific DNA recombinase